MLTLKGSCKIDGYHLAWNELTSKMHKTNKIAIFVNGL